MKTRIFLCKPCGQRRRHTVSETSDGWTYWCSQGHRTFHKKVGLARAVDMMKDAMAPSVHAALDSSFPLKEHFRR
jgi:hypothetical protein